MPDKVDIVEPQLNVSGNSTQLKKEKRYIGNIGTACLLISTHGQAIPLEQQTSASKAKPHNSASNAKPHNSASNAKPHNSASETKVHIVSMVMYSKTAYNSSTYVQSIIPEIYNLIDSTNKIENKEKKLETLCEFSSVLGKKILPDPNASTICRNSLEKFGADLRNCQTTNEDVSNRVFMVREYVEGDSCYDKQFGVNNPEEKTLDQNKDDFNIKLRYKIGESYFVREIATIDTRYNLKLSKIISTIRQTYINLKDLFVIDLTCSSCDDKNNETEKDKSVKRRADSKTHIELCPNNVNDWRTIFEEACKKQRTSGGDKNPFDSLIKKHLQNGGKLRTKKEYVSFVEESYKNSKTLLKKVLKYVTQHNITL